MLAPADSGREIVRQRGFGGVGGPDAFGLGGSLLRVKRVRRQRSPLKLATLQRAASDCECAERAPSPTLRTNNGSALFPPPTLSSA